MKLTRAEQNQKLVDIEHFTWNQALEQATQKAKLYDNNYTTETSFFTWPDKSVSVFGGQSQEIITYKSK